MRVHLWVASLVAVGGIGLIAAYYLRYLVVEPATVGAFCEAAITDWRCQIRQGILALLTDQRLGWLAIALAALSLVFAVAWMGWFAWFVASAGFVLYNAELAAPALLLAGVMLARSRHRIPHQRRGERRPADRER